MEKRKFYEVSPEYQAKLDMKLTGTAFKTRSKYASCTQVKKETRERKAKEKAHIYKKIDCLKCFKKFPSAGPHNRTCENCTRTNNSVESTMFMR